MTSFGHNSVTASTPVKGGTLNWAIKSEPSTLVPLSTTGAGTIDIGPKIVEGLLAYEFDLTPKPLLATAWQVSEDGLSYTFKLREGVQWHDGKPFTSADVAYSISQLKKVHPRGRITFANVEKIDTPDEHTVELHLSKPAPYLISALAASESPILPKHLYANNDGKHAQLNNAPIGTGPFIFKRWTRGSYVELQKNAEYWDKEKPYVDSILARFYPDTSASAVAFEAGDIDIGNSIIPAADVKRFQQLSHLTVNTIPWPYKGEHKAIYFNYDFEPFKNQQVRLAIAKGFSIENYAKLVWHGLGVPSASPIGKSQKNYHRADIKHHAFDIRAAEKLLDAAGYPKDSSGKRFKVRVLFNPSHERRAADFFRQSLQRIGIDAQVVALDFATFTKRVYTDRAFDIVLESLTNMFDPTIGVQRAFKSEAFQIGLSFSNPSHYSNSVVDEILEQAAVEPDEKKRQALFYRFQKIVHEDVASIELGAAPDVTILNKRVNNFGKTAEGMRSSFADVYLDKN